MLATTALPAGQTQAPAVEDVLRAAAEYVKGYEGMALVAQEEYTQLAALVRRNLQSDILFMKDDSFGWVEFRDVGLVNGAPVRDRQDRLLTLFTKPNPDRLAQAQRIVAEGARFNLNPPDIRLNRTINLPLTAVRFLRTVGSVPGRTSTSRRRIARLASFRWSSPKNIVRV